MIPDSVMENLEWRMRLAADAQDRARAITAALGRAEWLHRRESPAFGFKAERDSIAGMIRTAREAIRRNGLDTWEVCSQARDPDGHAFAAAGCTAAELRRHSAGLV